MPYLIVKFSLGTMPCCGMRLTTARYTSNSLPPRQFPNLGKSRDIEWHDSGINWRMQLFVGFSFTCKIRRVVMERLLTISVSVKARRSHHPESFVPEILSSLEWMSWKSIRNVSLWLCFIGVVKDKELFKLWFKIIFWIFSDPRMYHSQCSAFPAGWERG